MGTEFPLQEIDGVDGLLQVVNFVVQVRCGALPGITGNAHHVAFLDDIAGLDVHLVQMRVKRFKAEIVPNDHAVTAQFGIVGGAHHTVGGGADRRVPLGANVHALVE